MRDENFYRLISIKFIFLADLTIHPHGAGVKSEDSNGLFVLPDKSSQRSIALFARIAVNSDYTPYEYTERYNSIRKFQISALYNEWVFIDKTDVSSMIPNSRPNYPRIGNIITCVHAGIPLSICLSLNMSREILYTLVTDVLYQV